MRTEKSKLLRQIRRLVNRKFGGWKKFVVLIVCICIVIYCINSLFSQSNQQIWDVGYDGWNLTEQCGVKCNPGQLGFYIRTGESNTYGPSICLEGEVLISNDLKNYGRGLNVVLVNDKTKNVIDVKTFDTYTDDAPLIRFLKKSVPDNHVVLIVSFDDASHSLKEDSRRWLKMYGSKAVNDLGYRDGFFMIGQRGLVEGQAIEFLVKKRNKDFADYIEKAGCFDIPLGEQQNVELLLPEVIYKNDIVEGKIVMNCGLESSCEKDSFPVSVDTGHADKLPVQICVNGYIMMGEKLNKGGRGFNVMVIDPVDMKPSSIIHVDTYTYDSTDLEVFLESLVEGDIVIAVVGDDGSRKLSHPAKGLLNKLGSGHIQNLKFRDVWYFVGQMGINGFTTYEQMSYSGVDGEWPKSIQKSFCVPRKILGRQIIPDPEVYRNDDRRAFCKKYKGYNELCDPATVDDIITPVKILSQQMESNKVYSTPILIIPGLNHNALVRTFQTTLMQPGINPDLVTVIWDEKFSEHGDLAQLFGFNNQSVSGSVKYSDQLLKALKTGLQKFPEKEYFIVIEEELLLSPDFLYFMSQCIEVLGTDESLLGVSAWNFNGYEELSSNSSLIYRVEELPGLGFMMKRKTLETFLQPDNINSCCKHRAWSGWKVKSDLTGEILVPDVSRVFRQAFQGAGNTDEYIQAVFNRARLTILEKNVQLTNMNRLNNKLYEEYLIEDLKRAIVILPNEISECYHPNVIIKEFNHSNLSLPIAVYYKQENSEDFNLLNKLVKCFGFYASEHSTPRNLHKGLLRFYFMKRNIYIVGSKTIYYPYLPQDKLN